ncbi:MAG: hypothetical protein WAS27_04425 [Candidatus Saccharimonadales bacterium]
MFNTNQSLTVKQCIDARPDELEQAVMFMTAEDLVTLVERLEVALEQTLKEENCMNKKRLAQNTLERRLAYNRKYTRLRARAGHIEAVLGELYQILPPAP